jgi:hypothetical protein
VEPNPYESPQSDSDSPSQLEQLLLSPLRIPLAIAAGMIVLGFAVAIVDWSRYLATLNWGVVQHRELAGTTIPALLIEGTAFALISWGLVARQPRPIYWGLSLVLIGIILPVTLCLAMPAFR